jgi:hypothetical protein
LKTSKIDQTRSNPVKIRSTRKERETGSDFTISLEIKTTADSPAWHSKSTSPPFPFSAFPFVLCPLPFPQIVLGLLTFSLLVLDQLMTWTHWLTRCIPVFQHIPYKGFSSSSSLDFKSFLTLDLQSCSTQKTLLLQYGLDCISNKLLIYFVLTCQLKLHPWFFKLLQLFFSTSYCI